MELEPFALMESASPNVSPLNKTVFPMKYARLEFARGFVQPMTNVVTSKSVSIECVLLDVTPTMIVQAIKSVTKTNAEILAKMIHHAENVPNVQLSDMKSNVHVPLALEEIHLHLAFPMTKLAPLIRHSRTG